MAAVFSWDRGSSHSPRSFAAAARMSCKTFAESETSAFVRFTTASTILHHRLHDAYTACDTKLECQNLYFWQMLHSISHDNLPTDKCRCYRLVCLKEGRQQ